MLRDKNRKAFLITIFIDLIDCSKHRSYFSPRRSKKGIVATPKYNSTCKFYADLQQCICAHAQPSHVNMKNRLFSRIQRSGDRGKNYFTS